MRPAAAARTEAASAVRRLRAIALLCAAASAATGCGGGGGGGSGGPPPAPPTNVRVQAVAGVPDDVQLSWTAPAEAIDGYLVEAKVGTGAYQPQNDLGSLVPRDWTGLRVTLAAGTPDLVDYAARMRSVRAGAASSYSNEAVYHRPLNAPKSVVARFDWAQAAPVVQWDRNSTAATSVTIQRSEVDANGFAGPWTALTVADPAALSFVDGTATTDRTYRYQVANVAGAVTSAAVSSGTVYVGLRPPAPAFIRFDSALQAVVLSIQSANPDADGLRLERQRVDASYNPIGPWETVDVGPGVPTSFSDATWPENATVKYRVSNLRGTYASPPAAWAQAVSTPLYRPVALAATSAADGTITLGWENRSLVAIAVEVSWSPQIGQTGVRSILATLPAAATTYDVTTLGLGYYRFTVAAKTSTNSGSSFLDYTTPQPAGALALSAGALAANDATDAVLLPDGAWAFLAKPSTATTLSVYAPGDPFPPVQRTDALAGSISGIAPVLLADADGHPHVVYLATATDGGDPIVTHLWYDGVAWTSEAMYRGAIATGYGATPAVQAALDAGGVPQALVPLKTGASSFAVAFVRKDGVAGWTSEPVPVANFQAYWRLASFGLDGAGNPHFTYSETPSNTKTEYARDGAGAWHAGALATVSGGSEPHAPWNAVWIDAQNAVVLAFGLSNTVSDDYEVGVVEKVAGAWQPFRLLGRDRRTYGVFPPMRMAGSADRSRVAILYGSEVGVRAYDRDAGAWSATLVAPPQTVTPNAGWPSGFFRAGFDAGGKARFLVRKAPTADGYLDAREP